MFGKKRITKTETRHLIYLDGPVARLFPDYDITTYVLSWKDEDIVIPHTRGSSVKRDMMVWALEEVRKTISDAPTT